MLIRDYLDKLENSRYNCKELLDERNNEFNDFYSMILVVYDKNILQYLIY